MKIVYADFREKEAFREEKAEEKSWFEATKRKKNAIYRFISMIDLRTNKINHKKGQQENL